MVCGDSSIIAKVAMIVMLVSFIMATIAIFTPYWQEETNADGTTEYTGLITKCDNNLGHCFSISDIFDKYRDTSSYKSLLATLSLAMIGWVFGLAAFIVLVVYACLPNKITALVAIILCFTSGACIVAAVIVYGLGMNDFLDTVSKLQWSYGLDAAAGCLAIVAGVIVVINSCIIP